MMLHFGPGLWYVLLLFVVLSVVPHSCCQTETAQAVKPKCISVVLKWHLKAMERQSQGIPNPMTPGAIGRNELDMHADACCAGANWKLLEVANQACEVSPFLDSCDPVKEVPVA